jgi:hypothetical protein
VLHHLPNRSPAERFSIGLGSAKQSAVARSRCCRDGVAVVAVVRPLSRYSPVGLFGPRPYRPFAGGSRATIRSLRSPTFTRNGLFAIFFPCREAAAFLARQQDRSTRHPPLRCGPRLRAGRCGAQRSPSRPRWSRA